MLLFVDIDCSKCILFWGELYNSKISCHIKVKVKALYNFILLRLKDLINWAIVMLIFIYMPIYTRLFGMIRYLRKWDRGKKEMSHTLLVLGRLSLLRSSLTKAET
jgi:hypothetical protein